MEETGRRKVMRRLGEGKLDLFFNSGTQQVVKNKIPNPLSH